MGVIVYRKGKEEYSIPLTDSIGILFDLANISEGKFGKEEILEKLVGAFPKVSNLQSEEEQFYVRNDGARMVEFLKRYDSLEIRKA